MNDTTKRVLEVCAHLSGGEHKDNVLLLPILGSDRIMRIELSIEDLEEKWDNSIVGMTGDILDLIIECAEGNGAITYSYDNFPLWNDEVKSHKDAPWMWHERQFTEVEEQTIISCRLESNPFMLASMLVEDGPFSWIQFCKSVNAMANDIRIVKYTQGRDHSQESMYDFSSSEYEELPMLSWCFLVDKKQPTLCEEAAQYYKQHQKKPFEDNNAIERSNSLFGLLPEEMTDDNFILTREEMDKYTEDLPF